MACCGKWQDFILVYSWWYSIVYIYHIFFIHSYISGYLDCFHSLAVVNNAAMNIIVHWTYIVHICFKLVGSFPFVFHPEMELLDHMVVLFLIFWGTSILFPMVAVPIYIHTNSPQRFSFLHILTNHCYLLSSFVLFFF